MRPGHIIFGLLAFCAGLFLFYMNTASVIPTFKGVIHPAIILAGSAALLAALLGKKEFRTINAVLSGLLLFIGFFGLYDDLRTVLEFLHGFLPLVFIGAGSVSLLFGIRNNH